MYLFILAYCTHIRECKRIIIATYYKVILLPFPPNNVSLFPYLHPSGNSAATSPRLIQFSA